MYRLATKRTTKKQVEENASVIFSTTTCVYWFIGVAYCWHAVAVA